jgi:hypothetical protein
MTASKRKLQLTLEFERLCQIEPRLRELLEQAQAIKDDGNYFCVGETWSRTLKPRLRRLVGWDVAHPELGTHYAYDVVGEMVLDALPDCRECGCMVVAWEGDSE